MNVLYPTFLNVFFNFYYVFYVFNVFIFFLHVFFTSMVESTSVHHSFASVLRVKFEHKIRTESFERIFRLNLRPDFHRRPKSKCVFSPYYSSH